MQLEIIGPDGTVHYTRPHDHPDVWEALNTPGYSVRGTGEKRASGLLQPAGSVDEPEDKIMAKLRAKLQPRIDAFRESERITEDDLKKIVT